MRDKGSYSIRTDRPLEVATVARGFGVGDAGLAGLGGGALGPALLRFATGFDGGGAVTSSICAVSQNSETDGAATTVPPRRKRVAQFGHFIDAPAGAFSGNFKTAMQAGQVTVEFIDVSIPV